MQQSEAPQMEAEATSANGNNLHATTVANSAKSSSIVHFPVILRICNTSQLSPTLNGRLKRDKLSFLCCTMRNSNICVWDV